MKKFLITMLFLVVFNSMCFAQEGKTPINFVYIHGSDQGTAEEFEIWMDRMHPNMKKNLEANALVQQHLLQDAYIKPEMDMLYWADKTQKDKTVVEIGLKISKMVSSCIAQMTRSTLAHLLHDAIWVQKYVNMTPILNELNKKIISNAQKGEKTVIVGYSAGTFITLQYFTHKLRTFDLTEFLTKFQNELEITQQDLTALKNTNPKPTCMDAIIDADIAVFGADGKLIPISSKEKLRNNFKNLNAQTQLSCAPENAVPGMLNFGSPVVIFYSDNYAEDSQQFYFMGKLVQYIVENKLFALTVNYKTDPLGVPSENITMAQILEHKDYKNTKSNGGFIYDTAVKGGIMFVSSHLKYWDQTNHFTKAVAKSYEEGYNYFYGLDTKK